MSYLLLATEHRLVYLISEDDPSAFSGQFTVHSSQPAQHPAAKANGTALAESCELKTESSPINLSPPSFV
jgi:hypothetical protein